MNETQDKVTRLWELYEKGLQYQKNTGMKENYNECSRFFDGDQWPQATERTKNLPRPVLNITKFIANNKKSNILSSSMKIIYRPSEAFDEEGLEAATEGAEKFTQFAEFTRKDLRQADLDDKAMSDGVKKGPYIYHYFWDSEKYGKRSKYIGGINGEIIDPLNIFFANPRQKDEQKQKWIMISSRESLESIKELAKKNKIPAQDILSIFGDDDTEKNYEEVKQDNEEMVTVLTRYFRINDEVYYEKAVKQTIIQNPTSLTPNYKKVVIKENVEEDNEDTNPDVPEEGEERFVITLYPVIVGNYEEKEKSIFGMGEIEQIKANQKAMNFNYAMMLLSTQNTAWPKIIAKANALKGKIITNTPGEVITDYSNGAGDGIKYMLPPSYSPMPLTLAEKIMDTTRMVTGATEVSSGEVLGSNMSGSAIAALQTQAKVPVEMIQRRFWRVHEKIAKVWEQFFKTYYITDRNYILQDEDGQDNIKEFNAEKYQNVEFATTVDVGAGSMYSEVASIATIESLKADGDIDTDQYIELYPETLMPFKAQLKRMRAKQKLPPEIEDIIISNPMLMQQVMQMVQQSQMQSNIPGQQNSPVIPM